MVYIFLLFQKKEQVISIKLRRRNRLMRKKICIVLAFVLLTSLLLGACTKDDASTSGVNEDNKNSDMQITAVKDTLTVGSRGEPTALDPQNQNDMPSCIPVWQIYENLYLRNNLTGEKEPLLAEKWEYVDDKTIRFHIRKDVIAHNGDPFTARDVLFTVKRGKASAKKAFLWRLVDVENSKVIDDYTIDLKTTEVYAPFLELFANNGSMMVSEKAIEEAGSVEVYGRNPTGGTGPWKFKEWIAGDRIVLERFEDYWGEKPYFKYLVIRNIADDTTRAISLETGDIDFCIDVLPAMMDKLKQNSGIDIVRCPTYTTAHLGFNCGKKPLNDIRVRQALRYAIDLPAMVEVAYSGIGTPADGFLSPALSCYVPPKEDEKYSYDIEKAKALLSEAGYPNGFTIKLWANENQARIDMCEMLQNAWAKIGVKAEVQILEFGTYLDKLDAGEHDAYILGWFANADDGDFIHDMFYSKLDYTNNTTAFKNKEYDRLVDEGRRELDPQKRQEIYAQVQSIIRKEIPVIPIQFGEATYGIRSTLTGVDPDPQYIPHFRWVKPKNM